MLHPAANKAISASERPDFNVADFIKFLFPVKRPGTLPLPGLVLVTPEISTGYPLIITSTRLPSRGAL